MAYSISYYKKDRKKHFVDTNLRTVAACIKSNAETIPDRDAVVFVSSDRKRHPVTFKDLYENAVSVAKRFVALGVKRGDFVAIAMRTCPDWLYAFFGAMFAGAVPVNLAFTYTDGSDVIAFMNKIKTCSTIVLDPGVDDENWKIFRNLVDAFDKNGNVRSDKMPYLKHLICHNRPSSHVNVLTFSDMFAWQTVKVELPEIDPEDTFTLFQTSGSTGIPKAVVHRHSSFVLAATSWVDAIWMEPNSIYLNDRPFLWGGGFPSTIITGQTRVTRLETTPPPKNHVDWLFDVIRQERCTHMYALPLGFHSMLDKQVRPKILNAFHQRMITY